MTLTNVVFPEFCRPTSVSSISSFQKRLLNHSMILLKKPNILYSFPFSLAFSAPPARIVECSSHSFEHAHHLGVIMLDMLRSCRKSYVFLLLVCLFLSLVLFYSFSPTKYGISQNLRRENSSLVSFGDKLKDSIFTILAPSTPPPLPAFDEKVSV